MEQIQTKTQVSSSFPLYHLPPSSNKLVSSNQIMDNTSLKSEERFSKVQQFGGGEKSAEENRQINKHSLNRTNGQRRSARVCWPMRWTWERFRERERKGRKESGGNRRGRLKDDANHTVYPPSYWKLKRTSQASKQQQKSEWKLLKRYKYSTGRLLRGERVTNFDVTSLANLVWSSKREIIDWTKHRKRMRKGR